MTDDRGNVINLGDEVCVTYIDTGRGAQMWMHRGIVVGFNRTRVQVKFSSRGEPQAVGNECLRIVDTSKTEDER